MGLSDALNSLVSSLKGNSSVQKSGGTGNSDSSTVSAAVEEALGNELANIGKETESAKSIEEKANAALEDLMSKLGLSGSEADETLGKLETAFSEEIKERDKEKYKEIEIKEIDDTDSISETDKTDNVKETDETDEDKSVDDKLDEMTDEELEALYDAIKDKLEFSPKEADAYAKGEVEVKARIEEAIENNPDMDPAEIEEQIRAAYELENPEYAEAKEEAEAVMEKHDKAMDEVYNTYCEENPQPVLEDFDTPEEYAKALGKWASEAEKHMDEAERNYLKENDNYKNLKWAELKAEGPFEFIDDPITGPLYPEEPLKPILKDPGFSKIIPSDGIDQNISKFIDDSTINVIQRMTGGYDFDFEPSGNGANAIKQLMIDSGVLQEDSSGNIDYAGFLKTLID